MHTILLCFVYRGFMWSINHIRQGYLYGSWQRGTDTWPLQNKTKIIFFMVTYMAHGRGAPTPDHYKTKQKSYSSWLLIWLMAEGHRHLTITKQNKNHILHGYLYGSWQGGTDTWPLQNKTKIIFFMVTYMAHGRGAPTPDHYKTKQKSYSSWLLIWLMAEGHRHLTITKQNKNHILHGYLYGSWQRDTDTWPLQNKTKRTTRA